jgi:hypothetical protein
MRLRRYPLAARYGESRCCIQLIQAEFGEKIHEELLNNVSN